MRVLALTRYDPLGASSRLRTYQYRAPLEVAGIELDMHPFFDAAYLKSLYAGRRRRSAWLAGLARRLADLKAGGFDAVWIEKEALPWVPFGLEGQLWPRHLPVIVDYDDAIFHRYDAHRSPLVRALLGRKIDAVMRRADIVVAGNTYLAERAQAARCRRVEIVPTVVDLDRYPGKREPRSGPVRVGWIGSPSTAHYLQPIAKPVQDMRLETDVAFVAIGARPDQIAGTPFHALPWSEEGEAGLLASLDIGIMPLPDEPWERGKCGYKLIQYMACGLPVVASPVGANRDIVRHGETGFLAGKPAEWQAALRQLLGDAALRAEMGLKGRTLVETQYSLQVTAPRLARLFGGAVTADSEGTA
jgi:glycosyltransferase involved in cell wall biosynthesis